MTKSLLALGRRSLVRGLSSADTRATSINCARERDGQCLPGYRLFVTVKLPASPIIPRYISVVFALRFIKSLSPFMDYQTVKKSDILVDKQFQIARSQHRV